MSTAKLQAVTAALTVCVVAVTWIAASSLLDDRTPTERGLVVALAPLAERPPDQVGLVVLGTSLSHYAMLSHETLSAALTDAAGRKVAAANLSVNGADIGSYERVLDDIWLAKPDILVLQVELFRPVGFNQPDRSMRTRVTRWFEGVGPESYKSGPCRSRFGERALERNANQFERLRMGEEDVKRMRMFLEVATRNVETVVWLAPPRPQEITDAAMGLDLEIRADVLDAAADFELVPPFESEPPPLEDYCDFDHLSQDGAERYLAQWALSLQPLLAAS